MLGTLPKRTRTLVSTEAWELLKKEFEGHRTLHADVGVCAICEEKEQQEIDAERNRKHDRKPLQRLCKKVQAGLRVLDCMQDGESFLVDSNWFNKFEIWAHDTTDGSDPGQISNINLLISSNPSLRPSPA